MSHDLKGAHKWHDAYHDTLQLPCVVSRNGETHVGGAAVVATLLCHASSARRMTSVFQVGLF